MTGSLLAFLGVSAMVVMTPGQDTALIISRTLSGGRRGGVLTALGVCTGQLVWTLATSGGLAAVLLASEPAFLTLRYLGAAYLVFLGVLAIRAAVRGAPRTHADGQEPRVRPEITAAASFRQGLISNLGNAKVAVFFTSLLPQFSTDFVTMLLLGLIFVLLTFSWLSLYAVLIARVGDVLRRPKIRRVLDFLTGSVLALLGIRLAIE
ncbi:LysE family translocator [Nonomuraea candida]|uniref:LysE family translocator n=1 Tax=Nonomuraea candida TaxID=359159 RepID=UPI000A78EB97|nr:LysE family translocator [Nonomuraea candida]